MSRRKSIAGDCVDRIVEEVLRPNGLIGEGQVRYKHLVEIEKIILDAIAQPRRVRKQDCQ
jgi:hypothetical protein